MNANNEPNKANPLFEVCCHINDLIKNEKVFCQYMADFVRLMEASTKGLNMFEKRQMSKQLLVYKELSRGGIFSDFKELDPNNSSAKEVEAMIKKIHSAMQSTSPHYEKQKNTLAHATQKSAGLEKLFKRLIKGTIFSKMTGGRFNKIFSKNLAEYMREYNEQRKQDPKKSSLPSIPLDYINAILIKPTQMAPRYELTMKEIKKVIDGMKEQNILSTDCSVLMAEAITSAQNIPKLGNSKIAASNVAPIAKPASPSPKAVEVAATVPVPKPESKPLPKPPIINKPKAKPLPTPPVAAKKPEARPLPKPPVKRPLPTPPPKAIKPGASPFFANQKQVGETRPQVKDEVALIAAILNQKYPHSRLPIVKKIRGIIDDGMPGKLERIKGEVSKELLVGRKVGFSSPQFDSELNRVLRIIASGMTDKLEKELEKKVGVVQTKNG